MPQYGALDPAFPGMSAEIFVKTESKFAMEAIPFGYPMFAYSGNVTDPGKTGEVWLYHNDRSKVAFDADFVTSNSIAVTVNGVAVTAVVFDTDHETTMTNLLSQIETDITGATATLDTDDVNGRTFFVDIDGVDVVVTAVVTLGASQAVATITVSGRQVFVGVSGHTHVVGSAPKTDLEGNVLEAAKAYVAKDQLNNVWGGLINVDVAVAVSDTATAYVITSGANQGRFGATAGYDTGCKYRSNTAAAGTAVVEVRGLK